MQGAGHVAPRYFYDAMSHGSNIACVLVDRTAVLLAQTLHLSASLMPGWGRPLGTILAWEGVGTPIEDGTMVASKCIPCAAANLSALI